MVQRKVIAFSGYLRTNFLKISLLSNEIKMRSSISGFINEKQCFERTDSMGKCTEVQTQNILPDLMVFEMALRMVPKFEL